MPKAIKFVLVVLFLAPIPNSTARQQFFDEDVIGAELKNDCDCVCPTYVEPDEEDDEPVWA